MKIINPKLKPMRVYSHSVSSQTDLRISPVETPEIRINFRRLDDAKKIQKSSFFLLILLHYFLLYMLIKMHQFILIHITPLDVVVAFLNEC